MIPGDTTDSFLDGANNLDRVLNMVIYANFALSVFSSGSLTGLWSLMNTL